VYPEAVKEGPNFTGWGRVAKKNPQSLRAAGS
jgi:hypothetical protein